MNLFDNILKNVAPKGLNPVGDFMSGFTPTQTTPQPTQVQQPQPTQAPKPKMTLFSDEYTMLGKMKADGLNDDEAMNLLKQRRTDLLEGNTTLNPKEQSMLQKMQADNLTAKEATALIKQYRTDIPEKQKADFEKKYAQGNLLQKGAYNALMLGAGATEKVLQYGGNILDFATFGKLGFGEDVKAMQEVTKSHEFDSTARSIGKALPDIALAVSPIGGGYLAGAKGAGNLALRSGVVGAGFGAGGQILDKGSEATAKDIGKGALVGGTIGALTPVVVPALGKTLKKAGETLYKTAIKPTAQEAEMVIGAGARKLANKAQIQKIQSSKLTPATKAKKIEALVGEKPVLRSDTALKYGIVGTEKGVGVKGKAESIKLWRDKIAPAIGKSKAEHNIDDLFAKAEASIAKEKSTLRRQELMEGLAALREDFATTGKKVFTTGDLQAEKSMLDKFTPSKIHKGKEVAQGYTQVKNTLANIFREQVREDLGKIGGETAKNVYRDWANLSALEDIGIKGITEGGLKGGFGTFWSTIYDKVATPIKTIGGNTVYKVGDKIEFIGPKGIKNLGEYLKKKGYKVSGDRIINLSNNANAITVRGLNVPSGSNDRMD